MKTTKYIAFSALILLIFYSFGQNQMDNCPNNNVNMIIQNDSICPKCDFEILITVSEQMDSLNFKIINEFLCTFDTSCVNNVEFSQWSNELLFTVIYNYPVEFLDVVEKGKVNNDILLDIVQNPSCDKDFLEIYNTLKVTPNKSEIKERYLKAIKKAMEKE